MNWFYVDAGQQAGPVDEAQLDELRRTGKIQPETLVWREGMPNWLPYREARPEPVMAGAAPGAEPIAAATAAPGEAVCAECGKLFNINDTISYGTVRVCAGCKPVFMQKLAEGARIGGGLLYAGFWTRFAAVFLDGIILWVVNFAISFAGGLSAMQAA